MVKKWFTVRNQVVTINASVSKEAKQLTRAILLLNYYVLCPIAEMVLTALQNESFLAQALLYCVTLTSGGVLDPN